MHACREAGGHCGGRSAATSATHRSNHLAPFKQIQSAHPAALAAVWILIGTAALTPDTKAVQVRSGGLGFGGSGAAAGQRAVDAGCRQAGGKAGGISAMI